MERNVLWGTEFSVIWGISKRLVSVSQSDVLTRYLYWFFVLRTPPQKVQKSMIFQVLFKVLFFILITEY